MEERRRRSLREKAIRITEERGNVQLKAINKEKMFLNVEMNGNVITERGKKHFNFFHLIQIGVTLTRDSPIPLRHILRSSDG